MHTHAIRGGAWEFDPRALWLHMAGHRGGHRGGPHRRGHGFGPPGFGPGFGRGPRARRGDVRAALLVLLAEEPRNGYGLMQEIEARSGGAWRPSPGSVYPALQQLEDEGLVRPAESGGRKQFELTDEGRAYVTENAEALGTPWADLAGGREQMGEVKGLMAGVAAAAMQVVMAGDEKQVAEATRVLDDARRALYRILAGDERAEEDDDGPAAA
jgi:DNA-binding PadR family transcriptional regulator